MTLKLGREDVAAGAYQQRIGTTASSFTGVNVSSLSNLRDLGASNISSVAQLNAASLSTLRSLIATQVGSLARLAVGSEFIGNSVIRGLAVIAANTSVTSVVATGVVSGDVILTGPYMSGLNAGSSYSTRVDSVRADGFDIRINGTSAVDMTVAWWRVA